jgi:large subunit ribosomal protein L23
MAIFGFKKRKDEKLEKGAEAAKSLANKKSVSNMPVVKPAKKAEKVVVSKVVSPALDSDSASNSASVIIRPRITEKSGILSQDGVYTFEITKNANKGMVKKAVKALYKVTPVSVAVVNTPAKKVFIKGRKGTVAGIKKAVVTIKKGEKIDFV